MLETRRFDLVQSNTHGLWFYRLNTRMQTSMWTEI